MNTNHKYSLHQKFCLDYCWDQKNANLNYEEHYGYVNFLVESNWSLKKKKEGLFTMYVCKQINHLHSKEVKGERRGEGRRQVVHSLDHSIVQMQKYFRKPHAYFFFTQCKAHFAFLVAIMQYVPSLVSPSNFMPLQTSSLYIF